MGQGLMTEEKENNFQSNQKQLDTEIFLTNSSIKSHQYLNDYNSAECTQEINQSQIMKLTLLSSNCKLGTPNNHNFMSSLKKRESDIR